MEKLKKEDYTEQELKVNPDAPYWEDEDWTRC